VHISLCSCTVPVIDDYVAVLLGDSFSQIFDRFGLPAFFTARSNVILIITMSVLLPLSFLRRLDALKYTSFLGLAGTFYCAVFMVIRYIDNSYGTRGHFVNDLDSSLRPTFDESPMPIAELVSVLLYFNY
jgi:amino acid permease